MRISEIQCLPYRVPFHVPFSTSHGLEHHRHGFIVRITADDGTVGLGEAAALPAFGTGTTKEIKQHLRDLSDKLANATFADAFELLDGHADDPVSAPARFSMDTALLDLQARRAGLSLAQYLEPDAAGTVPVNATISEMASERAAAAASRAALAGYSAVKVKVGVLKDPEDEIGRVAAVRNAVGPRMELRLDANGAWSFEQAVTLCDRLMQFDIAYLEQPLPACDPENMARLRETIHIPVAIDEGATTSAAVHEIIRSNAADVLIFKPGVIGGLRTAHRLIGIAHKAGCKVVVTTGLEAGVAITAALHLAATLPHPVPACGLATGALLETDLLLDSPEISSGRMTVPSGPGLGVELSSRALTGQSANGH